MEKLDYKARLEEMEHLVSINKFQDAISIAEGINWRKVHNINDLVLGSEAYEAAGAIDEARELLEIAHERSPIGRTILYKLSMLSLKNNEIDEAEEYYKEFVQVAPHDSLKHILKYNIGLVKGVDTATLIRILEQLKEEDFLEEWAYELAYLYHKTNQGEKCIDLCDEIILWFGDGPVVERALELKMLYQPLDKLQEDKYRNFQQKKDGITEISSSKESSSSDLSSPQIKLPEIDVSVDKFNTMNLQAEIKKNIDEIMNATEKGAVSDNIEQIKSLVEEIPYLQVKPEDTVQEDEVDFSVNDSFKAYLEEGVDGQISLLLPEGEPEKEAQIEGQLTIEDVLADWERTKRAAEAAMEDAKNKELEVAKAKALREANTVLTRLEGAMYKLDAGMTSSDLLKEEYLNNKKEDSDKKDSDENASCFVIPKIRDDGTSDGSIAIPVIIPEGVKAISNASMIHISKEKESSNAPAWQPPTLDEGKNEEVDFKEASMMIADVNKMLQQEIDRLTRDDELVGPIDKLKSDMQDLPKVTIDSIVDGPIVKPDIFNSKRPVPSPIEDEDKQEEEAVVVSEEKETISLEEENNDRDAIEISEIKVESPEVEKGDTQVLPIIKREDLVAVKESNTTDISEPDEEDSKEDIVINQDEVITDIKEDDDIKEDVNSDKDSAEEELSEENSDESIDDLDDIQLPEIELPSDLFINITEELDRSEIIDSKEDEIDEPEQESFEDEELKETDSSSENIEQEQTDFDENIVKNTKSGKDESVVSDVEKVEESKTEKNANDINTLNVSLSEEDMDRFSFFLSIKGMKEAITTTINNISADKKAGNLVIIGEEGYGKTQLATNIIELLKEKNNNNFGGVGRITGDKLNEKDIQKLYNKIQGGALIIEKAGLINKQTAVTLSLLMESDKENTLIVLEDNKRGIDKAFGIDVTFAKRFTERIVIPVFSIDELVMFAKNYAYSEGFTFDEMGVLALYNRINLVTTYDHTTSLREVSEIMEDAMDSSSKGGFFNKVKYDKQGNIVIKEKDFES